uniref:Uncharacterized protein n=1 Tax=Anguilla anguilla TaxID=7936 RepID=A0A0E9UW99_ANGAN
MFFNSTTAASAVTFIWQTLLSNRRTVSAYQRSLDNYKTQARYGTILIM